MAKAVYINIGDSLMITNETEAKIAYGDIVILGERVAVAGHDILPGEKGTAITKGMFELPAKTGESFVIGRKLYWASADSAVTASAKTGETDNIFAGFAGQAKASTATRCAVVLG